jgi:hypothetical protein
LDDAKTNANLFCSGHAFLPDGRLLVAGGHLADSHGVNQVSIYDPAANTGTPSAVMNNGRWYPTAITLPDGTKLGAATDANCSAPTKVQYVYRSTAGGALKPMPR